MEHGRHFCMAEDGKVGRDDDRDTLMAAADQVERKLAVSLAKGR
jgi:hypothetical protein